MASQQQIEEEWAAKEVAWLQKHTKNVLVDTSISVIGNTFQSRTGVPIQMHVKAIELDYGPCIHFTVRTDKPFAHSMDWDDHPFRGVVKDRDETETVNRNAKGVIEISEILDDTPAVHAMIKELVETTEKKLYTGTDCTHRARLIAALRMFWS